MSDGCWTLVESEQEARELVSELSPDENVLEAKVNGPLSGLVDEVRRFADHEELQIRLGFGGRPHWLPPGVVVEQLDGSEVRLRETVADVEQGGSDA